MKIALVLEHMDPARGGCEMYTSWIATELAARGHDVAIVCQDGAWRVPGVELITVSPRGLGRRGRLLNFQTDVRAVVAGRGFDVVHSMLPLDCATVYQPHGGTLPARREASLRRRRGMARLAARIFEPLHPLRRCVAAMERRVAANPAVVCLCVSEMVAGEFRRYYGGGGDRVRVVFNSVAAPAVEGGQRLAWRRERTELGAAEGDTVFLTVANNFRLKGVDHAIRSFAQWSGAGKGGAGGRLVAVGGGKRVEAYRRLARSLGVGSRVRFVPHTSDMFQWYSAADAVVLLSWYDSCSLVVLEAAAWGVPSITTVYIGAAKVLAGGGGIVVPSPDDRAAVVAAMNELADPNRCAERAQHCLAAAQGLTMERHMAELFDVYSRQTCGQVSVK